MENKTIKTIKAIIEESLNGTEEIILSKEDIRNVRFVDHRTVVIGDYMIEYPSSFALANSLERMGNSVLPFNEPEVILLGEVKVKELSSVPALESAKLSTIKEELEKGIDYFLEAGAPFYGSMIKMVYEKEPPLIMEVYGMQDALSFLIEDRGGLEGCSDTPEEELFEDFVTYNGWIWIIEFLGLEETISLERTFFEKYYPILKR